MTVEEEKEAAPGGQVVPNRTGGSDRKKLTIFILLALVLAAFVWLISAKTHLGDKVYAQAAGHKIYKENVQQLIGKNKDISQRNAATVLADKYLTEALSKEQKVTVTVTDNDIQHQYGSAIKKQKTSNEYAYQYQVNQLYFKKLQDSQQGTYKGSLLVAHFSRYVAYQSPLLKEDKAAEPNIGNPAAIAKDKAYAEAFISNLYEQVKSGKMTFEQAIQTERSDPVLGEAMYPSLTHSGRFDTSSPLVGRNSLIQVASIKQKVADMKSGQLSRPFVVRVSSSIEDNSTAESYFLVVKMDSASGGNKQGVSFDQYLAAAKKRLGYKVNV